MKALTGPWRGWPSADGDTAVTIGVFDGVHVGHRETLRRLSELADGRPTLVATFDPHPMSVLAPGREPKLLTTVAQRIGLIEAVGVDSVAVLDFDAGLSRMSATEFVEAILVEKLGAGLIAVGDSFRFRFRREGDVALLRRLGASSGFEVEAVGLVGGKQPFSSTAARKALAESDLDEAERILGRRYAMEGIVVTGAGRGATIGVPTANLGLDPSQFIPGRGVYAVILMLDDNRLPGVCNVGVRPTFGGSEAIVEVHVLDFDEDIRGRTVELEFVQWIRSEKKFDGVDALVAQIHDDIGRARSILDVIAHDA